MWEIINTLGCIGWIAGAIALVALFAQRDANREKEKQKGAKGETGNKTDVV